MIAQNPVEWHFDFDMFFQYEIETKNVINFLPRGIQPQELRPGVAMICYGVSIFSEGNLAGKVPGFTEISINLVVHPNMAIEMPVPRVALFTLYSASTCKLQFDPSMGKMPLFDQFNLDVQITDNGSNGSAVIAKDDNGLLFELKNTRKDLVFEKSKVFGQAMAVMEEAIYLIPFSWEGEKMEHQNAGDSGKLYTHPALGGIIAPQPKKAYLQMQTPAHSKGIITYYDAIKIRDIKPKRS